MRKLAAFAIIGLICFVCPANARATTILLDADTPATGSLLDVGPLVTSAGIITFSGEIRDRDDDPEFNAAGALGDVFDIFNASSATMSFSFDVSSVTFIYGGNIGVFNLVARNAANATIASFFQASTDAGQAAGPVTLTASGIRSLFWEDPGGSFAPIDNLSIEAADVAAAVPEPASLVLLGTGLLSIGARRWKRRSDAA